MLKMINTIDLFAGCGGLTEGFKQNGNYNTVACVEWDKLPYKALLHRFKTKWGYSDADERLLRFDIQRTDELIHGWNDEEYGTSDGLDALVSRYGGNVDLIIGGPPCQAYSIAGRVRDENGMRNDYRNYLFEHYIEILKHFTPKMFLFENVSGMLSAMPGDGSVRIADQIQKQFIEAGYLIIDNLNDAVIDFAEYGVPQNRKRIVILGVHKDFYGLNATKKINQFYGDLLPRKKAKMKKTVADVISDLPKLYPLDIPIKTNGKQFSHSLPPSGGIRNHSARYNSQREIGIFKLLTEDIQKEKYEYTSIEALKKLYTSMTGRQSNIHKYYVLRWNEPSNTIPAHLYKDGLRHIHPDPEQARTITVREAARLQTFPDDFEFISGTALDYKMIGNAVPPLFAEILAETVGMLM
jgi:DNA (cytosine-5)-methyltransferase 1